MKAIWALWPAQLPRTARLYAGVLLILLAQVPPAAGAVCIGAMDAADRLQAAVDVETTAREALVTVRRNAQDWKNLLLRGRDPSERQTLQTRFDAQARGYAARLAQLQAQLSALGLETARIDTLNLEHVKLFERYRLALERHGVASLEAAASADREAQGSDVLTFRTLEQLIDALAAQSGSRFQALRTEIGRCASAQTTDRQDPARQP